MYPTVIIVLVEKHRSMTDICEAGTSDASGLAGLMASEPRPATLGHISFAVGSTYRTMDGESESQRPHVSQSQDREAYSLGNTILDIKGSDRP